MTREERMRQRGEEARAELVELDRLRNYLIKSRTLGYPRPLIDAIDDYVEQITGDRTTLHAKSAPIG